MSKKTAAPIHIPGAMPSIPAIHRYGAVSPGTEPLGREGPYRYIWARASRQVGTKKVHVIIYGAYDAYGLVGSECNGLVILNETDMQVVADEIDRQDSGWFGASPEQVETFTRLLSCSAEEFLEFAREHPRYRGSHAL